MRGVLFILLLIFIRWQLHLLCRMHFHRFDSLGPSLTPSPAETVFSRSHPPFHASSSWVTHFSQSSLHRHGWEGISWSMASFSETPALKKVTPHPPRRHNWQPTIRKGGPHRSFLSMMELWQAQSCASNHSYGDFTSIALWQIQKMCSLFHIALSGWTGPWRDYMDAHLGLNNPIPCSPRHD